MSEAEIGGALSNHSESEANSSANSSENHAPTLRIKPNGAIKINGSIDFVDETGQVLSTVTDVSLCTCGRTQTAPICDGSHKVSK